MKSFEFYYDVRYADGSIIIQAETKEEAKRKFDQLEPVELVAKCGELFVDIESINGEEE